MRLERNARRTLVHSIAIAVLVLGFGDSASSAPILSLPGGGGAFPTADSSHGWTFTVNEDLLVTDLGLFDRDRDGISIEHPIGIFRTSDSALLTSATISVGTANPLIDNFRYVDVADTLLSAGTTYTIAYYSAVTNNDFVVVNAAGLVVDPAITILHANWQTSTAGLVLPSNSTTGDRFGPNFLYTAADVPVPGTLLLVGMGVALWSLRRRSA